MSAEYHKSLMGGWAGDAQQMFNTCRERHLSDHYCTGRNWPLGGPFSVDLREFYEYSSRI